MSTATDTISTNIASREQNRLPKGWKILPLGKAVTKVGSGKTPLGGREVYVTEGRVFIRSQNVGWGRLILDDVVYIDEETHQSFSGSELRYEDVLLNITGASIGRAAVVDKQIEQGNVNQHVCIIRSKDELLNPYFLCNFLLSSTGQNLIDSYQTGGNRQGLNFQQIRGFQLALPPLPDQRAIATCLGTWDRAMDSLQQLIDAKEERKKWLMQMLLTGKKRLKGFEGEWQEIRLGELGGFLKGAGISKDEAKSNGSPAIRYGELYTCYHYVIYETKTFIDSDSAAKSRRIQYGDILIAGSGETKEEIGKCSAYLFEKTAYAGGDIIVYRPTSGHSGFLGYLLNSAGVNTQKRSFAKGHSVVHIYPKDMANIRITIPKTIEQNAIWQVFVIADRELELLQVKLDRLRDEKRGLLQGLLTGKKRLTPQSKNHGA